MTVGETTADDVNADVLVEFAGGHGQVLEVLDHLEARVRHTPLEVIVGEGKFVF